MKPAPPERNVLKPRQLRSLYLDCSTTGKRETIHSKLQSRKTTFKPPSTIKLKSKSQIQVGTIRRRTQTGTIRKDSVNMIRGISSKVGVQQCPQMNGFFIRPSVDVRSVRQKIMERTKRMEDFLKSEGGNPKTSNQTLISPAIPCTPKPSGLSMAFIKLSNYENKRGALEKTATTPSLEKGIIKKKINLNDSKVDNANHEKNSDFVDSIILAKERMLDKENVSVSGVNEISKDCLMNNEKDGVIPVNNTKHHTLKNIVNYCQSYFSKVLSLNKEIDILDDKFQSVMIVKLESQFQEKFSNYQTRKKKLYKEMELLEEELENTVKSEIDVESKFKEYLTKKKNTLKERMNLQENFEKSLREMIQEYEYESGKPAECKNLEEIVNLMSVDKQGNDSVVKPALRRSKRLLGIPKTDTEEKKSPRKALRSKSKKKEDNDELIVKRDRNYDKKKIQLCLYEDLQKSFILRSPECSF